MNSSKILSVNDCNKIEEDLQKFQENIKEYFEDLENGINLFNQNEIVQSFYTSGNLGKEMEEELKKIKNAMQKYYDALVSGNGLVPVTRTVVSSHRELLNKGYNGGN